ncbi:MAG: ATP synthase subunit I [Gammaproteobacteria bacterium]|nr:MAG: ATP synthase subunit I [Gammaproteobacteria bacterium]
MRRVLIGQGLIGMAVVSAFFMWRGWPAAGAAGYGALLALANTLFLGRSIGRASALAKQNPNQGLAWLYFGAAQRFVLLALFFALGMGFLHLSPFPMVLAFGIAQLAFLVNVHRPAEV